MGVGDSPGHIDATAAADVPPLEEANLGAAASLRQRLEQHRANPACGACHNQMDPLGFSLENYDAAGRWRTRDGKFDVDSLGTLPDGKTIAGGKGLREMLKSQSGLFTRNVAEKMLTFALGRGLERSDSAAVEAISREAAAGENKFSSLALAIVKSAPFQMRSGVDGDRMNPSKRLSRRAILQGMGAAIALPVLDAMTPAFAATAAPPTRMAFLYVPNGIVMDEWTPKGQAVGVAPLPEALPRISGALAPYRNDVMMLSGLTSNGGRALGDGPAITAGRGRRI